MLSIVIIEYNSISDVKDCIKTVKDYCSDIEYEIIISSNSCYPEQQTEEVRASIENCNIHWVHNERNGGFAYGMNRGLEQAIGDYLVIMNPDVRLQSSLSGLVRFLKDNPEVGAVAPQILGNDGDIQDSCRSFVTPFRFAARQLNRIFTKKASILDSGFDYSQIQRVDCVIGAFIMITRQVYEDVGGLDESYFMYAEDIDFCTRIRKSGYEVVYDPSVKIIYEGSRSARKDKRFARIFIQSHIKYWRKFGFFSISYPQYKKKVYF